VRQRIYAALPLPLGATSAGEWLEIALTERFEPEAIRSRLQVRGRQWGAGGGFLYFICRMRSNLTPLLAL